ncbi:MAG TPA: helix-hairpin-helix domain-containing protein [Candidatus Dormibacteraeota bacterium]|nr:helix-hairpin-helix domain-containing protein [Candidatus Dormibacteraeota bacterium]
MMNGRWLALAAFVVIATMVGGCSDNETAAEREAKIRQEVANAVAKAKPEIKEAGREVKAAAEGVKEGWEGSGKKPLDLNTASADDLASLPGIGRGDAKRIIAGRPYRERHELVSKKILTEAEYAKLREDVMVK